MRWQVSIFPIFILHQLCIGLGCQAYMVVSDTPELCGLDGIHPMTLNLKPLSHSLESMTRSNSNSAAVVILTPNLLT